MSTVTRNQSFGDLSEIKPLQTFLRSGELSPGFVPPDKVLNSGTLRNGGVLIKLSTLIDAGRGLFTGRRFSQFAIITVFGGQARHENEKESCDPMYTLRISGSGYVVDGHSFAAGIATTANAQGNYLPLGGDEAPQWRQGAACMANQRPPYNAKFAFVDVKDSLGGLRPRIPVLQALQDIPEGTEIFVDYGSSAPFAARAAAQQHQVDVADVHRLLRTGEVEPGNVRVSLHLMAGDWPIHLSGGAIILPSRHNGLHAFRMWQSDACKVILAVLEYNYLNQAEPGASCVGLLASLGHPEYNGYNQYHLTQAPRHLSAEQQRRTAVVRTSASMR